MAAELRIPVERGLVGDTLAPEEFFVGGIWPSLYTGVDRRGMDITAVRFVMNCPRICLTLLLGYR